MRVGQISGRKSQLAEFEYLFGNLRNTPFMIHCFSVFGVRSDDCTAFMLLLVPFILSWTIGYLAGGRKLDEEARV